MGAEEAIDPDSVKSGRITRMRKSGWLILAVLLLLSACQTIQTPVTILDGGQSRTLNTSERLPAKLLTKAGITLGANDRLLYLGASAPLDTNLPESSAYTLTVRRAVALTIVTPDGTQAIQTSALTVGQALAEDGYTLYAADRLDPPAETPLDAPLTVTYQPSRAFVVTVDGTQVRVRSAAATVGQALAEAGIPLVGLDYAVPSENEPLPANGQIRMVRVVESVAMTQKSIPFGTRTELSADLELDQQALLQGGEPGLATTRQRTRNEDGVQVSQKAESESIVRPPQDRIMGCGTKIVIRTAVVDGITIEYYRAVKLMTTSYSPCRSALPDGRCSNGTSSGLPVQRGTVAMVYSWYLAFGFDPLYIPGYGYATVGDVGGGAPPGNHYWVDLGWTDAEYQPMTGWETVYFLTPVPKNLVYVLP
jgi:resuscitation-promoting factor RpfB